MGFETKQTFGFRRKYPSSKTASGKGKFNLCKLWYNPVEDERKSGIPAEVDIPAPVRMTIFLTTKKQPTFFSLSLSLD